MAILECRNSSNSRNFAAF